MLQGIQSRGCVRERMRGSNVTQYLTLIVANRKLVSTVVNALVI